MKIALILISIIFGLFASCARKTEYKNPEIGMRYAELTALCAELPSGVQTKQDKNISYLIVEYSETPKSECNRTFTFENGKLTKIE